ncbi:amidohydrolase family protein [soil metagenome]
MPPSKPHGLSRRRLLGASAATALLAACSGRADGNGGVTTADLEGRQAMDMQPLGLAGLLLPGQPEPVGITLSGRRIAEIGESVADGVATLDLGGSYAIPGMIDSHVHMQFASSQSVLAGGVTTVRDLGGAPDAAQAMRGQSPLRILIAGRILTAVSGYPTRSWGADGTGREVRDPDDALAAVDEQLSAGAVVLKVALEEAGGAPVLDVDTLRAIVRRGSEANLQTTAHVGSAAMLDRAIEAGVRELCHLPLHDVTPAEMARAAEAGMVLVPTLEIRGDDPAAIAALGAFREAGGQVLYGTDLGNTGTAPGIEVREVRAMLAAGMSPAEVLRSATSDPALYMALDTGRLEAGKVADIVILGADPFEDPTAYDDVRLVVAGGEIVFDGTT